MGLNIKVHLRSAGLGHRSTNAETQRYQRGVLGGQRGPVGTGCLLGGQRVDSRMRGPPIYHGVCTCPQSEKYTSIHLSLKVKFSSCVMKRDSYTSAFIGSLTLGLFYMVWTKLLHLDLS